MTIYQALKSAICQPRQIAKMANSSWLFAILIYTLSALFFAVPLVSEYNSNLGLTLAVKDEIKSSVSQNVIPYEIKNYQLEGSETISFYVEPLAMYVVVGENYEEEVENLKTLINIANLKTVLVCSLEEVQFIRLSIEEKVIYTKTYEQLQLSIDLNGLSNYNSDEWQTVFSVVMVALNEHRVSLLLQNVPLLILRGFMVIGIFIVLIALITLVMGRTFKLKTAPIIKIIASCTLPIGIFYLFSILLQVTFVYYLGNIIFIIYANTAVNAYRTNFFIKSEEVK